MDKITKLGQQPLEKVFAEICKLVPNEIISIPSNKRSKWLHTRVFEFMTESKGKKY